MPDTAQLRSASTWPARALSAALLLVGAASLVGSASAGTPVVARLGAKQGTTAMTGEIRTDLSGGDVRGLVDAEASSGPNGQVKRQGGGAASGRFKMRIELSGRFAGGLYGAMDGQATLSGTFTDAGNCVATIGGTGRFTGSVSAPLGLAQVTASWEQAEFQGCGLVTPQPFSALLPSFTFDKTDTVPVPIPAQEPGSTASSTPSSPGGATVPMAGPVASSAPTAAAPPSGGGGGGAPMGLVPPLAGWAAIAVTALVVASALLVAGILVLRLRSRAPGTPALNVRATVQVRYGDGGVKTFQIRAPRTTIGREPGNALVLSDPQASTLHAEVVADRHGFVIRDAGSTNGTTLNGHRITEARLAAGDVIGIGSTELTFGQ